MMLLLLILILIIMLLVYVLPVLVRYKQLKRDYQSIPCPPISPIPFIGNLHLLDKRRHLFYQLLFRMAKVCQDQDKGLFCFWYSFWPVIFISRGQGLETFINHSKQLVKSYQYTFYEPWLKTGLLTSNNAKWRSRRRLLTPSFHDTNLLHSFMVIFNNQTCILVQNIEESIRKKERDQPHDLYPYISACTLDIIAEAAMGENAGVQNSVAGGTENEFAEATVRVDRIIRDRMRFPWLWPAFIFNRLPIGREQKKLLNIIHSFSRKIIQNRWTAFNAEQMENNSEKKTNRKLVFLDNLLSQMHAEHLSMDDIQEEVDTFMFEGHDTVGSAINFAIYLISAHPDVQAKVHAEIDAIFGDDLERPCTIEDAQAMTYLEMFIKECMRVIPTAAVVAREAQEDFIYRGHTVRKGTNVVIFISGIHKDSQAFPNPDKFDPDRFSADAEKNENRSPYSFIPFSSGSRNCIGQRFAGFEEKVVLSTLLRHFSFRSTQTIDELYLSADSVVRPLVPIKTIVERRQR